MKKEYFKRGVAALLAFLVPFAVLPRTAEVYANEAEDASYDDLADIRARLDAPTYLDYKAENDGKGGFTGDVLRLTPETVTAGERYTREMVGGRGAVVTNDGGTVEWGFNAAAAGWYRIELDYFPLTGNSGTIERSFYIDGELPFKEAYLAEFNRVYQNDGAIIQSGKGDDIRPKQVDVPTWLTANVKDRFLYYGEALYFFFAAGAHTLEIRVENEIMAIGEVRLISEEIVYTSYADYLRSAQDAGASIASGVLSGGILKAQAESAARKSDITLYPINDNSSMATEPSSITQKRLNAVGGTRWQNVGQTLTWEMDVPADGLYTIGFRSKQDVYRDMWSDRALFIDGAIPFEEASDLVFKYSDKWKVTLAGGNEPFLFYLTKGVHEISLCVVPGSTSEILARCDRILAELNAIRYSLITVMGAAPDVDRDYMLDKFMPETLANIRVQHDALKTVRDDLLASLGGHGDAVIAQIDQLLFTMDKMNRIPDKVPELFGSFRGFTSTFASWMNTAKEKPLLLDYIFIGEQGAKLPKAEPNIFMRFFYGLGMFFASFFIDYTYLSDETNQEAITVWIGNGLTGGRDQALSLNRMIIDDFTAQTGISVRLQLVSPGTLLPATLAGKGPDIALQVGGGDPVNWAMRNAVYDLSQFGDFQEIATRFHESTLVPFRYEGGVYAIPETFSFPMLFYREDILADMGLTYADFTTWDDVIKTSMELQRRNMQFGLSADQGTFSMFLYQFGGEYYKDGGRASDLDSRTSIAAFIYWMDFYRNYGFEKNFDFASRFRQGEMPIGIADYTMYNLLSVSAPEIKGQWKMAPIPGRVLADGSIDNVAAVGVSGAVMMRATKNPDSSWEFMKWWTEADTQYVFGRELESVMGSAARYNTANIEAMSRLPWSSADLRALQTQMLHLDGVPEVPGGYYTSRYIDFAKTAVYDRNENPKTVMSKYVDTINAEILQKRIEFHLD